MPYLCAFVIYIHLRGVYFPRFGCDVVFQVHVWLRFAGHADRVQCIDDLEGGVFPKRSVFPNVPLDRVHASNVKSIRFRWGKW